MWRRDDCDVDELHSTDSMDVTEMRSVLRLLSWHCVDVRAPMYDLNYCHYSDALHQNYVAMTMTVAMQQSMQIVVATTIVVATMWNAVHSSIDSIRVVANVVGAVCCDIVTQHDSDSWRVVSSSRQDATPHRASIVPPIHDSDAAAQYEAPTTLAVVDVAIGGIVAPDL